MTIFWSFKEWKVDIFPIFRPLVGLKFNLVIFPTLTGIFSSKKGTLKGKDFCGFQEKIPTPRKKWIFKVDFVLFSGYALEKPEKVFLWQWRAFEIYCHLTSLILNYSSGESNLLCLCDNISIIHSHIVTIFWKTCCTRNPSRR